jgi:hypothetical protein
VIKVTNLYDNIKNKFIEVPPKFVVNIQSENHSVKCDNCKHPNSNELS